MLAMGDGDDLGNAFPNGGVSDKAGDCDASETSDSESGDCGR